MIQLRQDVIDAWLKGLQDELLSKHPKHWPISMAAIPTSNRSFELRGYIKGQQENLVPEAVHYWWSTLFGEGQKHSWPATLESVTKLEALILRQTDLGVRHQPTPLGSKTREQQGKGRGWAPVH